MEHEKKQIAEISARNQEILSFFEKDSVFVFVYKKTEKLASAIYIITNLFSDSEPMKWTLRKKASEIVSFTLSYKDVAESAQNDFVYSIRSKALEIVSLLEISFRGGLISHMNFSILKQEFLNLVEVFSMAETSHKESALDTIPETFFEVPKAVLKVLGTRSSHTVSSAYAPIETPLESQKTTHAEVKDMNASSSQNQDFFKRTNRQNIILNLIKKKKEVTIKDVAQVIKDCSEKTIQRELIAFINAGVLKRTGERRWSKYSLA